MVLVAVTVCDRIWENQPIYCIMCGNSHWITKTLIKIKRKRVLLEDEVSDWLQIWTAASSLDIKAIKKNFVFLANRLVFPNTVTYMKAGTVHPD